MFTFKLDYNKNGKYTTLYIKSKNKTYEVGILGSRVSALSDFISGVHKEFEFAAISRVDLFLIVTKIVRGVLLAKSMAHKVINSNEYTPSEKDTARRFIDEIEKQEKINKGG